MKLLHFIQCFELLCSYEKEYFLMFALMGIFTLSFWNQKGANYFA